MNESFKTESAEILDADESRSMKMQRNKNAAKHRHYLIKAALKDVSARLIAEQHSAPRWHVVASRSSLMLGDKRI